MVENRKRRGERQRALNTSSWTPEMLEAHKRRERLQTPVAEMALSTRTINALESRGLIVASSLLTETYTSLMETSNFGEKTLVEVRDALIKLGLDAPSWDRPPGFKPAKTARSTKPVVGLLKLW